MRRWLRSRGVFILIAFGVCAAPDAVTAEPIAPGGSVRTDGYALQLPTGPKLAEKVLPFTFTFPVPAGKASSPPPFTDGRLTSSVYRDTATGGLSFVYAVAVTDAPDYTDEDSVITVGSFAGFATDVSGNFPVSSAFPVMRSADGSTLQAAEHDGRGGPPVFRVDTDATAFDDRGIAEYFVYPDFEVYDPLNPDAGEIDTGISATATLAGVYQPVPDPAAASLLALLLPGLLNRRRTRTRGRCPTCGAERER